MESPRISAYTLYFQKRESSDYILLLIVWIYLRSHFSGGFRKFCLFLQEWRFGRSRSSKVIDFGTNRKRVSDFLWVRHSNLGAVLHRFEDNYGRFYVLLTPPLFHSNFGVFPLHHIAHFGVSPHIILKLFGRVFQPMWSQCTWTLRTDGQTGRRMDRQLTVSHHRAVRLSVH